MYREVVNAPEPLQPIPEKPSSHMVTGMVLRAFAAHDKYRLRPEAHTAGNLLAGRLFKPDKYADRRASEYWTKFSFPFWFTDLLSALDSLSKTSFRDNDPRIHKAMDWFFDQQTTEGIWNLNLLRSGGDPDQELWISYAVCRVMKQCST
jgi:hypothetical protein